MRQFLFFGAFFFLGIEAVTLIGPELWRMAEPMLSVRFAIDVVYFFWILRMMQRSKVWGILFIGWAFLPVMFGVSNRYELASATFLRVDAVVSMGFVLYAIVVFHGLRIAPALLRNGTLLRSKIGGQLISWMISRSLTDLVRGVSGDGATCVGLLMLLHQMQLHPDVVEVFHSTAGEDGLDWHFSLKEKAVYITASQEKLEMTGQAIDLLRSQGMDAAQEFVVTRTGCFV